MQLFLIFVAEFCAAQPIAQQMLRQGGQPQAVERSEERMLMGPESCQGEEDGGGDHKVGKEGPGDTSPQHGLSR